MPASTRIIWHNAANSEEFERLALTQKMMKKIGYVKMLIYYSRIPSEHRKV